MSKPKLAKIFKSAQMAVSKHSPEILTGLGIAGMITTTILAVRATPKALQLIEQKKEELDLPVDEKMKPIEIVKVAWKPYIPATVTGLISVSCLIGASSVSMRRNAALATAYKLSESALTEYRDKVLTEVGEKKEQLIREKVAQDNLDKNPVTNNEVIITGKGDTLCYDYMSKRYFTFDIEKLRRVENELNKRMIHDICGNVSLNEFYDEIGLERVEYGDDIGWNTDELIDIGISPGMTDDDKPCIVVKHHVAPKYKYY